MGNVIRKKRLKPLIFLLPVFVALILILPAASPQAQKKKVYTFTFSQLKPFMKFKMPSKYMTAWKELLKAKKQGKDTIPVLEKHNVDLNELFEQFTSKKAKNYARDLVLGRDPMLAIAFKGAATAPKGTPQYDIIYNIRSSVNRVISKHTKNVKIKIIYYPGGVLGDEPDFVRRIKLGEIQWAGGQLIMGQMIAPELSVFDLPFLYDYEPDLYWNKLKFCQIDWIWGKVSASVNNLLSKRGFILVGLMDGGCWYSIATRNFPVKTAEDLTKLKYHMFVGSRIAPEIKKAVGYRKVIVSRVWDLNPNSVTGMIDSMVCGYYWQVILQTAPYYNYVTDYPLDGHSGALGIVDKRVFTSLLALADTFGGMLGLTRNKVIAMMRDLIMNFSKSLKEDGRKIIRKYDGEARRRLLKSGKFKLAHFSKKELDKVKKKILPLYGKLADKKGAYPKWFLEEILKYREEYRKFKREGKLSRWWDEGIYPDGYDEYSWTREWTP